MKKFFFISITTAIALSTFAQEPRVLFIGNSYTEVNNLPQMVANIAQSMGDLMSFSSNTPGGCTFQQHCNNQSMNLICQGGWDIVVIQEQSQLPSFPQNQVECEVFPFAKQLIDSIYLYNPCAKPIFFMTWGHKNGDQRNANAFPVIGTYEGMDSMICLRYTQMAEINDASLCPVGKVWHYLRNNNPDIELYQNDGSHPSIEGTYAAACAFYTLFFHRNPENISYDANLNEEVAQTIRNATKIVVFDALNQWERQKPSVFIEQSNVNNSVVLNAHSEYADSLFLWFGDECDTAMQATGNDTIYHTYSDTGLFIITLIASRHCMTDTITTIAEITNNTNGISNIFNKEHIRIFPNPTTNLITICTSNGTPDKITIYDLNGRIMKCEKNLSTISEIHTNNIPNGTYIVEVYLDGKTTTKTVVIERKKIE